MNDDSGNPADAEGGAGFGRTRNRCGRGAAGQGGGDDVNWERSVLRELALASITGSGAVPGAGAFSSSCSASPSRLRALVVFAGLWPFPTERRSRAERHTALVDMNGVIESKGEASAEAMITALRAAFEDSKTAGVVLRINSPGGSPVQAGIIHDEIRRLRAKYPDTPLYAVVEEVCASGGYYVAVAADQIFVDKASLIGSIGVLMDGFGFVAAMDKLGVERRLLTAGRNKGFLDSFSPLAEEHRGTCSRCSTRSTGSSSTSCARAAAIG